MNSDLHKPLIGERIDFRGVECDIVVSETPDHQPLLKADIAIFIDQYGERHLCERDGAGWQIVRPDMLTPEQEELLDPEDDD